jgi:hypothetical protein
VELALQEIVNELDVDFKIKVSAGSGVSCPPVRHLHLPLIDLE